MSVSLTWTSGRSKICDMIDWNGVDTVLLDMDGTLLDLHFDNFFWKEYLPEKWGMLNGIDPVSARETLIPKLRSRKGTLSWYCLDYWSRELGLDVLNLNMDLEHMIRIRPHAEDFLVHLGGLRKHVLMVTNAHEKLLELKLRRTGISQYFDEVISAHSLGLPKEEVSFWRALNAQHPFNPERTLLIDDNPDVLRSAATFGIRHLLTIEQPDSHAPARRACEFDAIASFALLVETADT